MILGLKSGGAAAVIVVASQTWAGPVTYDLGADWSEAANPNGVWSLREGNNALPHVDWWQRVLGGWASAQPGWARSEDANTRLPFWLKSNGSETFGHDWIAGDIVIHSTDSSNGAGSGLGNVVWTSPCHGVIDIEGQVWIGRDIGRGNTWRLFHNDVLLTSGIVASGDAFSRASPFLLSAGSGGASVLADRTVAEGDSIRLELERTTTSGEFVGVVFRVLHSAGPTCIGDADASRLVNFGDLTAVLTNWGATAGTCPAGAMLGDADHDGLVNFNDITTALAFWLTTCP